MPLILEKKHFVAQMRILVQDTEGALTSEAMDEDKVFTSALQRALSIYDVDRPLNANRLHTIKNCALDLEGTLADPNETTIFARDFYALCKLAASEACGDLSRHFTHSGAGNFVGAEMSDFRTLGDQFASRKRELLKEYRDHIGNTVPLRQSSYSVGQRGASRAEIASRLAPETGRAAKIIIADDDFFW